LKPAALAPALRPSAEWRRLTPPVLWHG